MVSLCFIVSCFRSANDFENMMSLTGKYGMDICDCPMLIRRSTIMGVCISVRYDATPCHCRDVISLRWCEKAVVYEYEAIIII